MKADIAVVGSGLAALVATRTLQQAGRNALLIWPGLSSLYFTYATVDVLGYSDLTTTQPVDQPEAGVAQLIEDHPEHPYALAGLDALRSGTALLTEWLRDAGFTWQGSLARNLLLPTAIGTPKPSCLVPASMAARDLRRTEPIVVCGLHGYEDFGPRLAALRARPSPLRPAAQTHPGIRGRDGLGGAGPRGRAQRWPVPPHPSQVRRAGAAHRRTRLRAGARGHGRRRAPRRGP